MIRLIQVQGARGWHVHIEKDSCLPYAPTIHTTFCGQKIERDRIKQALMINEQNEFLRLVCPRCYDYLKRLHSHDPQSDQERS